MFKTIRRFCRGCVDYISYLFSCFKPNISKPLKAAKVMTENQLIKKKTQLKKEQNPIIPEENTSIAEKEKPKVNKKHLNLNIMLGKESDLMNERRVKSPRKPNQYKKNIHKINPKEKTRFRDEDLDRYIKKIRKLSIKLMSNIFIEIKKTSSDSDTESTLIKINRDVHRIVNKLIKVSQKLNLKFGPNKEQTVEEEKILYDNILFLLKNHDFKKTELADLSWPPKDESKYSKVNDENFNMKKLTSDFFIHLTHKLHKKEDLSESETIQIFSSMKNYLSTMYTPYSDIPFGMFPKDKIKPKEKQEEKIEVKKEIVKVPLDKKIKLLNLAKTIFYVYQNIMNKILIFNDEKSVKLSNKRKNYINSILDLVLNLYGCSKSFDTYNLLFHKVKREREVQKIDYPTKIVELYKNALVSPGKELDIEVSNFLDDIKNDFRLLNKRLEVTESTNKNHSSSQSKKLASNCNEEKENHITCIKKSI